MIHFTLSYYVATFYISTNWPVSMYIYALLYVMIIWIHNQLLPRHHHHHHHHHRPSNPVFSPSCFHQYLYIYLHMCYTRKYIYIYTHNIDTYLPLPPPPPPPLSLGHWITPDAAYPLLQIQQLILQPFLQSVFFCDKRRALQTRELEKKILNLNRKKGRSKVLTLGRSECFKIWDS